MGNEHYLSSRKILAGFLRVISVRRKRGLIRVLFRGATRHNKKNVRTDGCDGRVHTRCQSAEECFAMLELIDALISWPFIPTFRLSRHRSGPPWSSNALSYYLFPDRPGHSACSIEYFLSAENRKNDVEIFRKIPQSNVTLLLSVAISFHNSVPKYSIILY